MPVKGYSISIICDLQRKTHIYIPEGLYEILTLHKNEPIDKIKESYNYNFDKEIDEYIDYLIAKEYGFLCTDPERFPDINFTFETPEIISNAILDFNASSSYDYTKALTELDLLGCKFLELRFFDIIEQNKLIEILCSTLYKRFKNIDLYIKYSHTEEQDLFLKILFSRFAIGNVVVHSSPFNKDLTSDYKICLLYTKQEIKDEMCCGYISKSYFTYDIRFFSEGLAYNNCLNKKISVDATGAIKNCPALEKDFGYIDHISFADVLNDKIFKNLWTVNKDQVKICKDCQFRYICSDCRAFVTDKYDKPQKCNYNPYTDTWK